MTNNKLQNARLLVINTLYSSEFSALKDNRKQFILNVLLCFLSIKGRINFLQLSRYSKYCEQYFRINIENKFNFQVFNRRLILNLKIKECIIASTQVTLPRVANVHSV